MAEEGIIVKQDNGLYAITNLGAILFAKRLVDFPQSHPRCAQYQGNNRLNMLKEDVTEKGYVVDFERLIKEAVAPEFIKPLDPTTAPRYMKYIPIWA